jgi:hypothetical protein
MQRFVILLCTVLGANKSKGWKEDRLRIFGPTFERLRRCLLGSSKIRGNHGKLQLLPSEQIRGFDLLNPAFTLWQGPLNCLNRTVLDPYSRSHCALRGSLEIGVSFDKIQTTQAGPFIQLYTQRNSFALKYWIVNLYWTWGIRWHARLIRSEENCSTSDSDKFGRK